MWRFFMTAPKEPMDPKQQDTSEHLEVNDAQDMPDNTDIQDQEQQVAEEDWATLLSESQTKVAQYHEELLRAKAEVENIHLRSQVDGAKADRKTSGEGEGVERSVVRGGIGRVK